MIRAVSGALNQQAAMHADDINYKANGQKKKKSRRSKRVSRPPLLGWFHTQCGDLWASDFIHFEVYSGKI